MRSSELLPGKKITRVKLESGKLKSELALGSGGPAPSRQTHKQLSSREVLLRE